MNSINGIYSLINTSGMKEKQNVIKEYSNDEDFRKLLYYSLNPLITYNLSESTLTNKCSQEYDAESFRNIFDCCEYLSSLRGADNSTIDRVRMWLYSLPEKERTIYTKLLSKTLRLGVTAKTVNKIIPNLIPEWEVQQSFPIEKYPLSPKTEFWVTQKLNGVRATLYKGNLVSRSGSIYKGLDHIINQLLFCTNDGFVLDGELTLKSNDALSDNEAFRIATGILNSDEENKEMICYTIFDMIPVEEFENPNPILGYRERRKLLDKLSDRLEKSSSDTVSVLPLLYNGYNQNRIWELLDQMVEEDKEGLIINTNSPYKRTRHKGILKVKRFYTMDLQIIDCEEGSGRLTNTLGALVVEYKGNKVKVGSGFTDEQRNKFWETRQNLIGVICEVKYKEISYDKNTGLESLQFPVFVSLRLDKTNESFF